jgi:hypothetical protein
MLPVVRALSADPSLAVRVVATGQHREMVDQILGPFGVVPDHDLNIMKPDQTMNDIVCRTIPSLERLYVDLAPKMVLVQGDTTSAFAAALAAFHRRIVVGHVEAGLRTFDRFQPYPEESNRRMISSVADLHLAATSTSAENLRREGIKPEEILITGNTVIDSLLETLARPDLLEATAPRPADRPIRSVNPPPPRTIRAGGLAGGSALEDVSASGTRRRSPGGALCLPGPPTAGPGAGASHRGSIRVVLPPVYSLRGSLCRVPR